MRFKEYKDAEQWQMERQFMKEIEHSEQMTLVHLLCLIFCMFVILTLIFFAGVVG